jgi:putative serine protease PepD
MFSPEQHGTPGYGLAASGGSFGAPPPSPPPREQPSGGRRGGARLPLAVAVVLLLLAAAAGFGGGLLANQTRGTTSSNGVNATVQQVTLQGDAAQPAAAVAKALSPAVVQLQTGNDLGSGFIYDPSGLILTAAHVVGNATKVRVTLNDATRLTGDVVGSDLGTDVAVVRITPPKKLTVAALGSSSKVQVGQTAIAIGSPFGLTQTVTQGIVSATGRAVQTEGGSVPMIQTDAPINPGNSGGALANVNGQVIGINDAIYTSSNSSALGGQPGNVGVGFAVPIDLAKTVADRLVAGQPVGHGYLGIEGANSTGSQPGAVVQQVEPDTPAAKAGLKEGDLVTAVNGKPITSMGALAAAITTHQPGDTVTLTIERDGKSQDLEVTLGDRSEALKGQGQDQGPSLIPGG